MFLRLWTSGLLERIGTRAYVWKCLLWALTTWGDALVSRLRPERGREAQARTWGATYGRRGLPAAGCGRASSAGVAESKGQGWGLPMVFSDPKEQSGPLQKYNSNQRSFRYPSIPWLWQNVAVLLLLQIFAALTSDSARMMDAAVSLSLVIAVRKTFAQTTEQDSLCLPETILKCTLSYDLT